MITRGFNHEGPRRGIQFVTSVIHRQIVEILTGQRDTIVIGNPNAIRDYTHVKDTVNALIGAAETSYMVGPINIGSGKEINVGQVAKHMAEEMGCELKVLNKDVVGAMRMCCDNSKAKRLLNWEAKVDFRDGLKTTIDWYRNQK